MNLAWIVPFLVGVAVVLQGGLNRQVTAQWGLANTVLVNGIVFLAASLLLWAATRLRPGSLPQEFLSPDQGGAVGIWHVILPGIFGVLIVIGLPWTIARLGALGTVLILIVTQLVVSMIWDTLVEGIAIQPVRVVGATLALVGAWLAQPDR